VLKKRYQKVEEEFLKETKIFKHKFLKYQEIIEQRHFEISLILR
jgi:hypothetical protein